jgi:hypothetical protein
MNRLKQKYTDEVKNKLQEEFGVKNIHALPKLKKVVINMGLAEAKDSDAVLDKSVANLTAIAGQKPVVTKAKKSIAAFKVTQGQTIGVMVTLRGERMYSFLDKLINIVLPKVRDFLLILIILSSLAFLIFTILLEISRQSFQAHHNLKIKKNSILQNTIYSFLWISPLLVAVNYFAVQKNYNFDLSAIGKFSFSPTSRQILKEVKKEIQVTAFFPRPLESDDRTREESFALGFIRPEVEIILDQLKAASPFISVKFINADVEKESANVNERTIRI